MFRACSQVLDALLHGCCCREERASVIPEAFTPPGITLTVAGTQRDASPANRDIMPNSPLSDWGADQRACTTPRELLHEITTRQSALASKCVNMADASLSSTATLDPPGIDDRSTSDVPSQQTEGPLGDAAVRPPHVTNSPAALASGEQLVQVKKFVHFIFSLCLYIPIMASSCSTYAGPFITSQQRPPCSLQVLRELSEDVMEYESHVYRHKSPLERFGRTGPW